MQGHLEILLPKEVELADGDTPAVTSETYAEYPLIIVSPLGFVAPAGICTTPRPLGFVPLRARWDLYYRGRAGLQARVT